MGDESHSWTDRMAAGLVRWRWPLLIAAVAITAAAVWPSTQLRFDVKIANLFPPDDPVLLAYQDSIKQFGGSEIVVAVYTDPELLTAAGLRRLGEFAGTFKDLRPLGMESVASLAEVRWPGDPTDTSPLYEQVEKRRLSPGQLKTELLNCALYRNVFLAEDGQTAAVVLTIRPEYTETERRQLIAAIRQRAGQNRFPTAVAGGPLLTHDAAVFMDQDARTLSWVSTLVLMTVIAVLFRRLRWVLLPLAVVHVSLIWTKGVLWLAETHLSMVSTTLTALVTVIGVASVVQVTARYREERERADARGAMLRTIVAAGPAVFWASVTTAAGIGSLLISSIVPVQNFAIMLAMASMFVFVAIAALGPGMVIFGRRPRDPGTAPGEHQIERGLERMMAWSLARPRQVAAVAAALLALTLLGIFRIRAETDFTRNFRPTSEVVVAYRTVEESLRGVGTLELNFTAPDGITPELVDRLRTLQARLRDVPHVTKVLGLTDALDLLDKGKISDPFGLMAQPIASMPIALKLAMLKQNRPDLIETFWNGDTRRMRIMLRSREQAPSAAKNALIAEVERVGHEVLDQPGAPSDVRATGVFVLLNHLVAGLMADQLNTLLIATAAVFLVMALALRSFGLAFVGLVPKLAPILMVLGAMGWFGVPIDMGTPMVASVSVGISVGFSIHYLCRFRQERLAGLSFDQALQATHRRVGSAMVFSNLALVIGFAALGLSNFVPTVHFSVLIDVALIGGLAGNLLVLPLLLKWVPFSAGRRPVDDARPTGSPSSG